MSKNNEKIRKMTTLAILMALVIVLQIVSTLISRAAVLPFNLTLTMIPIIVGALFYGISGGTILGFTFGMVVLVSALTGLDPSCAPLMEGIMIIPFTFLCLFKATAAGFVAGLVCTLLKNKNQYLRVVVAAVLAPLTNTGIFLLGMLIFYFGGLEAGATATGTSIIYYMIVFLVGTNFLIELATTILLSPAVVRIRNAIVKDRA